MEKAGSEVYDFIFKLDRRVGYLEKDIAFIEKKITDFDNYEKRMYGRLDEEMQNQKTIIDEIKKKLKNISIGITSLSSDMKDVIKKEQQRALSQEVDDLPLNEYITKRELRNI